MRRVRANIICSKDLTGWERLLIQRGSDPYELREDCSKMCSDMKDIIIITKHLQDFPEQVERLMEDDI